MTEARRDLREIDALVAEKVMGWTDVHFNGPTDRVAHEWYGTPPPINAFIQWPTRIFSYTTDPIASKALRDKLAEMGWSWGSSYQGTLSPHFCCEMYNGAAAWQAIAETEELAVTLCALKSVNCEVPGREGREV